MTDNDQDSDPQSRQGPLGDLAASIDERERHRPPESDLFEKETIPEIDSEVLWKQLETDDTLTADVKTDPERRVIDKSRFCEQCEHFSAPPEMHCMHDGTEIIELTNFREVTVLNCPIVKRDEELEQL